jgi:MFS family permease
VKSCADLSIVANGATLAMPAFDLFFGHYNPVTKQLYLDSIWTSLWSSMTNVGSILGSAVAGPVSQKIGRRYTGMVFGSVTASHPRYLKPITCPILSRRM